MRQPTATPAQTDLAGFPASELCTFSGAHNEAFYPDGRPREHWQTFLQSMDYLGHDELVHRAENARRILREHGVGHLASQDARTMERPWELDILPFIISAAEWREIEAGVIQRAQLLNLVLRDLYGRQRLLRNGFVPAPLVYANPGYLRACQAIPVPEGNYLHTYAVDLVRAPDGLWWVLADRTQAPTGMGFALENRSVISRVLPESLHAVQPRPLSSTLWERRDALSRLALRNRENPTVVLLTPGPRNEAYFEHAYLARLLGFTLVEGGDLTVRDRGVFIKTLNGLQRVDVLLRRLSDAFCDPLELRGDSLLGVPGLVEAARAGQVTIANALGSGLVEGPGFLPFLPGLSRHVLGEELRLPTIATWWCGQGREFRDVAAHFEDLAVSSAFTLPGHAIPAGRLPEPKRAALWVQLQERPHDFIGQELIHASRAPSLAGHQWKASPVVLRVFATFDGHSFSVMPGGLARLLSQPDVATHAMGLGGGTKDVWVLGEESHQGDTVHVAASLGTVERPDSQLPSRTADNFFWLGRYTERLEHLARVTRCVIARLNGEEPARLAGLHRVLVELGIVPPLEPGMDSGKELQRELLEILHDPARSPGAHELLQRIQFAGFAVRDRLSSDTWRLLNRMETDARFRPGHLPLVHAASVLQSLVLDLTAFSGLAMENMTRGHGWVFLDFGRRLERGASLLALLSAALRCDDLDELLEPVLEIQDSVMTHRRRYFADLRPATMLELLLADATNPRSLAFQLARLTKHSAALPNGANPAGVLQLQEKITVLAGAASRTAHLREDNPPALARTLDGFAQELDTLSELVTQVYFSHIVPQVS